MNTAFILMAQYGAKAVIPVEDVCQDYFRHLTPANLVRKVSAGELALPLVRMDAGRSAPRASPWWIWQPTSAGRWRPLARNAVTSVDLRLGRRVD